MYVYAACVAHRQPHMCADAGVNFFPKDCSKSIASHGRKSCQDIFLPSVVAQLSACYESVHDAPAISGDSAPSSAVADLQTALGFYRTTNQPEIALTSTGWVCGNRDENTNQKVKYGRQKNVLLYSFSRL